MPAFKDIPGLPELWAETHGDERIRIGVIDGRVALDHPCFEGARVTSVDVPWERGEADSDPDYAFHATFICSEIVGQWGSPVEGIAPDCTVISIPAGIAHDDAASPMVVTQALELAAELKVDILHCAVCHPTSTCQPERMALRAVQSLLEQGVLMVAPLGNDRGHSDCFPAHVEGVIGVGAVDDEQIPAEFTNWGNACPNPTTLMAPGRNVLGARPDGGTETQKGTSVAAPIVTAVSALLASLQLRELGYVDTSMLRAALLQTTADCAEGSDPNKCPGGVLNVAAAHRYVLDACRRKTTGSPEARLEPSGADESVYTGESGEAVQSAGATDSDCAVLACGDPSDAPAGPDDPADIELPGPVDETGLAGPVQLFRRSQVKRAFVLGDLDYDFGSEARRSEFAQRMARPEDAAEMVELLKREPTLAARLIWLISQQGAPLYAVRLRGGFAGATYEVLIAMLEGQQAQAPLERVSVPGLVFPVRVGLRSGESVPVLLPTGPRGMFGWSTAQLVEATLPGAPTALTRPLADFLQRVYYERTNPGLSSPDRALNFTATNAFQAGQVFASQQAAGLALEDIEVHRSPYGRIDSDCWDVLLRYRDPDNDYRADRIFRLTVDVADTMPVTMGKIQTWLLPQHRALRG